MSFWERKAQKPDQVVPVLMNVISSPIIIGTPPETVGFRTLIGTGVVSISVDTPSGKDERVRITLGNCD